MIFIWDDGAWIRRILRNALLIPPLGDLMTKSGTLISAALLTFGIASAAMSADMPKSAAPMAADTTPAAATPATNTPKPAKKPTSKKKKKPAAPAPTTTK
jgi:hypothetical protein